MADKRKYKLKKGPSFEIVEGALAGKKFKVGETYTEIPGNMANRFIEVKEPVKNPEPNQNQKQKKAGGKD